MKKNYFRRYRQRTDKMRAIVLLFALACASAPKPKPEVKPCTADMRWDSATFGECPDEKGSAK